MYKPHRDHRFEYLWDMMSFIEDNQCRTCVFRRTDDEDYPMCFEISGLLIEEEPVEQIDDIGELGLSCTKYRNGEPTPQQVDGQGELF